MQPIVILKKVGKTDLVFDVPSYSWWTHNHETIIDPDEVSDLK